MNSDEIIAVAADVANILDIPMKRIDLISKHLGRKIPTTTILHTQDHMLWIDAHYIAVDGIGETDVLYIYISREHINEELYTAIELCEGSETLADYSLYDNIACQLTAAKKQMDAAGTDFFLCEQYEEIIRGNIK